MACATSVAESAGGGGGGGGAPALAGRAWRNRRADWQAAAHPRACKPAAARYPEPRSAPRATAAHCPECESGVTSPARDLLPRNLRPVETEACFAPGSRLGRPEAGAPQLSLAPPSPGTALAMRRSTPG